MSLVNFPAPASGEATHLKVLQARITEVLFGDRIVHWLWKTPKKDSTGLKKKKGRGSRQSSRSETVRGGRKNEKLTLSDS